MARSMSTGEMVTGLQGQDPQPDALFDRRVSSDIPGDIPPAGLDAVSSQGARDVGVGVGARGGAGRRLPNVWVKAIGSGRGAKTAAAVGCASAAPDHRPFRLAV